MERECEDFGDTKPIIPPAYLLGRIIDRIRTEKKLAAAKRKTAYFSITLAGSITLSGVALLSLGSSLVESALLQLFPVLLADSGTLFAHWQDFGFFFLESLPIAHLIFFLITLLAVLRSLQYVAKHTHTIVSLSKPLKIMNGHYGLQ